MDWLEQHHVMLNCLYKSILCTNSLGNQVKVQGIPKKVSVRQISPLQANKCVRKGWKFFAVNIWDIESNKEQQIEYFPIIKEFNDVFLEEIHRIPLKWYLDISIELTPGSVPDSKAPYCISALELVELKL